MITATVSGRDLDLLETQERIAVRPLMGVRHRGTAAELVVRERIRALQERGAESTQSQEEQAPSLDSLCTEMAHARILATELAGEARRCGQTLTIFTDGATEQNMSDVTSIGAVVDGLLGAVESLAQRAVVHSEALNALGDTVASTMERLDNLHLRWGRAIGLHTDALAIACGEVAEALTLAIQELEPHVQAAHVAAVEADQTPTRKPPAGGGTDGARAACDPWAALGLPQRPGPGGRSAATLGMV
jgi:hypothetical protein